MPLASPTYIPEIPAEALCCATTIEPGGVKAAARFDLAREALHLADMKRHQLADLARQELGCQLDLALRLVDLFGAPALGLSDTEYEGRHRGKCAEA
jgi:hypothetical protein